MNLKEIYDNPVIPVTRKGTHLISRDNIRAMTGDMGHGSFGYTRPNPVDPHLIAKRNRMAEELDHDAYYQYITYVVKHQLAQNNIHFPRIYNIVLTPVFKKWFDKNPTDLDKDVLSNLNLYRVDMERLYADNEVTVNEMMALLHYTIADEWIPLEIKKEHLLSQQEIYFFIVQYIRDYYDHAVDSAVFKDKQLVEAMNIVMKIVEARKAEGKYKSFWLDTKRDNYLLRRTHVGLQIVFSDPLA